MNTTFIPLWRRTRPELMFACGGSSTEYVLVCEIKSAQGECKLVPKRNIEPSTYYLPLCWLFSGSVGGGRRRIALALSLQCLQAVRFGPLPLRVGDGAQWRWRRRRCCSSGRLRRRRLRRRQRSHNRGLVRRDGRVHSRISSSSSSSASHWRLSSSLSCGRRDSSSFCGRGLLGRPLTFTLLRRAHLQLMLPQRPLRGGGTLLHCRSSRARFLELLERILLGRRRLLQFEPALPRHQLAQFGQLERHTARRTIAVAFFYPSENAASAKGMAAGQLRGGPSRNAEVLRADLAFLH